MIAKQYYQVNSTQDIWQRFQRSIQQLKDTNQSGEEKAEEEQKSSF